MEKLFRGVFIVLGCLLFTVQVFAADDAALQIKTAISGNVVTVEQILSDDKVMISVTDANNQPLLGLAAQDFVISSGERKARIISAEPISETLEVPRNFVLVLDNSYSMFERKAVKPLLAGVDVFFKMLRPIDRTQIVVFSQKENVTMGGRDLHVRSFESNNIVDLKNFVIDAYDKSMTSTTVLYEAMYAGLQLMREMPENEPRFMVVMSDGEDINSSVKKQMLMEATEGIGRFHAYGIDYMPKPEKDKFLTAFAEGNGGETWKATSAANLVPIFESVASKIEHYYIVSYLFPTKGSLTVSPTTLTIDEVQNFDAAGGTTASEASVVRQMDASTMTLRPTVDTDYSIDHWKLTVANSLGTVTSEIGNGSPAAEIYLPLMTDDVDNLARGGDLMVTMEVTDNKGQTVEMSAEPVKVVFQRTTGSLVVSPATLTVEEIKTIDSSPMLGYIYFDEGSSDIPTHYIPLAGRDETASFNETSFGDTMEKYYQVLNIIGKRLIEHPEATIILTGCNSNSGPEKGNEKLSAKRAGAVRDYFLSIWGIAPKRIRAEERNLPEKPSSSKTEEGKAENRRVEIRSDVPEILAPIRSTYFVTKIDSDALTFKPTVQALHGVARWTATAENRSDIIATISDQGEPPAEIRLPLGSDKLNELVAAGDITVRMAIEDSKGQQLTMTATPVTVNFIQTSQRLAQKQDYRIQEKYALILFDFDSDAISAGNEEIVTRIVSRMKELPQATAEIVGHTDNIGKDEYNIKLSERRALAVYRLLEATFGEEAAGRIRHRGVGPYEPLYNNATPEARAFNRTVTITLEYIATGEGT
jgi:outer membrane protein OmpA-like peptidoglycan-associated protein